MRKALLLPDAVQRFIEKKIYDLGSFAAVVAFNVAKTC